MKTPLIIISFDGLATADMNFVSQLPGFKRYLDHASGSKHVKSIYPSVTYAAHASIITGCYPIRHGIIDNTKIQPARYESPDWYWYKKDIKVPTLYDLAKDQGYSVAALLWPTTGRAKIDMNMPEIFNNRKWTSQLMVSFYAGTPSYQIGMVKKNGHLRKGKQQPALDHFTTACTLDTIHQYQPDMLLVHLTDLDSIRHLHGHNSTQAKEALTRHDERLNQILDALASYEKYNHAFIVVLGDHSSKDVTMGLSINGRLAQLGYMENTGGGQSKDQAQLTQIKAYAKSCDGSCYIYGYDDSIKDQLRSHLEAALAELPAGSARLIDHSQVVSMGADSQCWFMLEATPPYHFVDDLIEPWVQPLSQIPYYKGAEVTAVHGFMPELEDYDTVFYVRGPGVTQGIDLGPMSLVDIAPTLAQLMGWSLPDVDGQSLHLNLQKENA